MADLREQADMAQRKRAPRGASNIERIQFYVRSDPGGCWLWTGCINTSGYGTVWTAATRRNRKAHRVAYEAYIGPIPDGLQIDHLCRVRHCVNPAHLEPVTAQVNTRRGETMAARHASVTHCPQGHEYTPENTYSSKRGERDCRICRRHRSAAWARKKRAQLRAFAA